jgi:hypothetical protein
LCGSEILGFAGTLNKFGNFSKTKEISLLFMKIKNNEEIPNEIISANLGRLYNPKIIPSSLGKQTK